MPVRQDREIRRLIEEEAGRLGGFVRAMVGDRETADDVLQSALLEIWRNRRSFRPGTDFGAWSRAVARNCVRRHWRKAGRERVAFSTEAVDRVSEAFAAPRPTGEEERRRWALATCLDALPPADRDLVRGRYNGGISIRELARMTGRSEGGLKMTLMRLRRRLARCVRARLAREAEIDG